MGPSVDVYRPPNHVISHRNDDRREHNRVSYDIFAVVDLVGIVVVEVIMLRVARCGWRHIPCSHAIHWRSSIDHRHS